MSAPSTPVSLVSERDRQILRALASRIDPNDAAAHNNLGVLYFNKRMLDEALEQFRAAIAIDRGLRVARENFVHALRALGQTEEAEREARRVQDGPGEGDGDHSAEVLAIRRRPEGLTSSDLLEPTVVRPTALPGGYLANYHRGVTLRERGRYADALDAFRKAIEEGEQRDLVEQALAEVLLVDSRPGEAAALFDELLGRNPGSPKLWNERGVCHHVQGEIEAAIRCYTRALSHDAEYALAENNIAVAQANRGDTSAARDTLESLVRRRKGFAEALCNLGLLAMQDGRTAEAVVAYRTATEDRPDRPAGWIGLAAALAEDGSLAAARNAIVRAVELGPDSAEARYRLAFILNRLGDVRGSLEETRKALALDPYFTTPRLVLAIELQFEYSEVLAPEPGGVDRVEAEEKVSGFDFDAREVGAAIARLRTGAAAEVAPVPHARRDFERARELMQRGALTQALSEIRRVVVAGGDAIEGALLSAEALQLQGLEGEAVERFETAAARLEGEPWSAQHTRAWVGRAECLLALGKIDEARAIAAPLGEHAGDDPRAGTLLAEILLAAGDAADALAHFTRLSELDSDNAAVRLRQAVAARKAGRLDLARRTLREVISMDPDLAFARLELGALHLAEGEFDDAAREGREALAILPGYADAARLVADAERAAGRPDAAITVLAELLEEDAYHLPSIFYLGQILLHEGRYADARVAFRRVLRLDMASADAWIALGRAYAGEGRRDEAAACSAQAAALRGSRIDLDWPYVKRGGRPGVYTASYQTP